MKSRVVERQIGLDECDTTCRLDERPDCCTERDKLASVNQEQAHLAANAPGYTAGATRIEIIARNAFPNLVVQFCEIVSYSLSIRESLPNTASAAIPIDPEQCGANRGTSRALNAIAPDFPD